MKFVRAAVKSWRVYNMCALILLHIETRKDTNIHPQSSQLMSTTRERNASSSGDNNRASTAADQPSHSELVSIGLSFLGAIIAA